MASHGRAPWYGPDGKVIEAYVIGIAGGSASGKVRFTSLLNQVTMKSCTIRRVQCVINSKLR